MTRTAATHAHEARLPTGPTAVAAALEEELAGLRSRLVAPRRADMEHASLLHGMLGRRPVVLACVGDGPAAAQAGVGELLDRVPVTRLLLVGVAGGLSPGLAPGSAVAARRVLADGGAAPAPDLGWLDNSDPDETILRATVTSGPRILDTAEAKARAYRELGEQGPAVVDLESAAVAAVAADRGVPYAVIRAISDDSGESLPIDFNLFRDSSGRLDRPGILRHALARPHLLVALWLLRARTRRCSETLAECVCRLLMGEPR